MIAIGWCLSIWTIGECKIYTKRYILAIQHPFSCSISYFATSTTGPTDQLSPITHSSAIIGSTSRRYPLLSCCSNFITTIRTFWRSSWRRSRAPRCSGFIPATKSFACFHKICRQSGRRWFQLISPRIFGEYRRFARCGWEPLRIFCARFLPRRPEASFRSCNRHSWDRNAP